MAKIHFFPMDLSYKEVNDKPVVCIYGVTESGKQLCVMDNTFEPYFYVVARRDALLNISSLQVQEEGIIYKVTHFEILQKKLLGQPVRAYKVFVNLPRAVPPIRQLVSRMDDVESCFEYDIPFVRRYLIDKAITPLTLVEAECEPLNARAKIPVFAATKVFQFSDDTLQKPRILAFDIETYNPLGKYLDPEKNPIIMISFYGEGFEKVFTSKHFSTSHDFVEFVDSEKDLIEKWLQVIEDFRPDFLVGYYSEGFDIPYIADRAKKYKIKLSLNYDHSEIRIKRAKTTSVITAGLVHLDILNFIRKIASRGLDLTSFDLDSVAKEVLGESKVEVDMDSLATAWDTTSPALSDFAEYNLIDSKLAFRLAEKFYPNIVEMVRIVGLPAVDVSKMGFSQLVEWYLLRLAPSHNELAPNKPDHGSIGDRKMHTYEGAFVYEPKPGLYHDIVLFDFKSLYPTIIVSHNISPETMNCECCEDIATRIPEEARWFCTKKKGFIPAIIEDLITRRMRIKEMMKSAPHVMLKAREQTLKLMANAFYGYLGFFGARWYNLECAKSVPAFGRFYITDVIEKAKSDGFEVLYSDTDSVFLLLNNSSVDEAVKFAERLNVELPGLMELEYEGFFPAALFVSLKAGVGGAKKKYALLDANGNVKIKGFETVRRNWSFIAKDVQRQVIGIVLRDNDPKKALDYVKEVIQALRDNKVPIEKVVIHTQLQKIVEEYDSIGPHVRAAMRMKERPVPGMIIRFVIVKGQGKLGDRVRLIEEAQQEEYDASYYINNQIIPSVERIFDVLGIKREQLLEERQQKDLKSFFK